MNVELWCIGPNKEGWLKEACDVYAKRIPHLIGFRYVEHPNPKVPKKATPEIVKQAEADLINKHLQASDQLILFDEHGQTYTSRKFAAFMENLQHRGGSKIVLLIGGAYGFSESLHARANSKVRLSSMTCSHQLIRVMALEQLYRAYSILGGLPYHND